MSKTDHNDGSLFRIIPDDGVDGGVQDWTGTAGDAKQVPSEEPFPTESVIDERQYVS